MDDSIETRRIGMNGSMMKHFKAIATVLVMEGVKLVVTSVSQYKICSVIK